MVDRLYVNGKNFSPADTDVVIFSDASLTSWRTYSNDRTARGTWTSAEKELHINALELLGAFHAIRSFAER